MAPSGQDGACSSRLDRHSRRFYCTNPQRHRECASVCACLFVCGIRMRNVAKHCQTSWLTVDNCHRPSGSWAHTRSLQSFGRSSPRCCRLWSEWTSILPGTTACVRSPPCWRWRWCRWSWCIRRRSSGLCCGRRFPRPTRKWSRDPSSPDRRRCREDNVRGRGFVSALRGRRSSSGSV